MPFHSHFSQKHALEKTRNFPLSLKCTLKLKRVPESPILYTKHSKESDIQSRQLPQEAVQTLGCPTQTQRAVPQPAWPSVGSVRWQCGTQLILLPPEWETGSISGHWQNKKQTRCCQHVIKEEPHTPAENCAFPSEPSG